MSAITITISSPGRAIVADGRLVAGESADVSVVGAVPAALYLVDASRDVVAACTSFVAGETSATGVLNLATVPLAEIVAEIPAGRAIPIQAILEDAAGAVVGYGLLNVVSAPMPDALDPLDIDLYIRAADIRALFADVPTAYANQRSLSDALSQVVGILQRIGLCAALALSALATEWQDVPANTVIGEGLTLTNGTISAAGGGGGIGTNDVRAIIEAEAGPTNRIVHADDVGDVSITGAIYATDIYTSSGVSASGDIFGGNIYGGDVSAGGDLKSDGNLEVGGSAYIVGTLTVGNNEVKSAAYRDAGEFASAADLAAVTQRVDVASSDVVRYASGVLRLDVPALATLSADTSGWPDGAAVMCRLSAHGAYAVAPGLDLVGYGMWPTNSASVVLVRAGSRVLANVMEGN